MGGALANSRVRGKKYIKTASPGINSVVKHNGNFRQEGLINKIIYCKYKEISWRAPDNIARINLSTFKYGLRAVWTAPSVALNFSPFKCNFRALVNNNYNHAPYMITNADLSTSEV